MEELHKEMLEILNNASPNSNGLGDGWNEVGKRSKSSIVRNEIKLRETPVSRIFGGVMRLELRRRGMKNTVSTQPFHELQLDIHGEHVHTLQQALEFFMLPRSIQGLKAANGRLVDANQHVTISPPLVLVFQLKRFAFCGMGEKLDKDVSFPSILKLPRKMVNNAKLPLTYELRSIVVHHGKSLSGGHYTAYVKQADCCLHFNDDRVERVSERTMMNQKAYLLFYERNSETGQNP